MRESTLKRLGATEKNIFLLAAFSAAFLLAGCLTTSKTFETALPYLGNEPCPSCPPNPKRLALTLAVNDIYCEDTACSCVRYVANRKYGKLQKELREKHNIDLKLKYFMEPYDFDDAIASRKYDGAISKPWRVYAVPETSFYKRLVDISDPNGNRWLWGILIVNKGSKFKKLADLNGVNIAMGNKCAYEKHYSALKLLAEHAVKPGKITWKASCLESVGILLDGEVDAAAISNYALEASCVVDIAKKDDFRILAETEKIPLTSMMLDMRKVSMRDAERLRRALLAISNTEAEGKDFHGKFLAPTRWDPSRKALEERGKK
jgi:ABC-type phosphate/phosphonate transport system substrate-binding protein